MKIITKIICGIILLSTLLSFTACGDKKSISTDDFVKKMEDNSYKINDKSDKYESNSDIKSVILAYNDDYQIEFYEFSTSEIALASFKKNKDIFEGEEGSTLTKNSVKIGNHGFYGCTTNGKYSCVSYIDNTMIYVKTSKEYRKEIKSIIKKLGYNM